MTTKITKVQTVTHLLLCRSDPVDLKVTRSLRWPASPPSRPVPGDLTLDHFSQHGLRLSFSMGNRSFSNAGPVPQAEGESRIILLLARESHRAGSFSSPNQFHEIYLGGLSGSTLNRLSSLQSPVACRYTTCCIRHKAYQSPCYLPRLGWGAGWSWSANLPGSESATHNLFDHMLMMLVEQVQSCRLL